MRVLVVVGGNLFQIALEHLGDATQWNRIAALNGLRDPFLQGITSLKVPAVDPAAGGGVAR